MLMAPQLKTITAEIETTDTKAIAGTKVVGVVAVEMTGVAAPRDVDKDQISAILSSVAQSSTARIGTDWLG